MTRVMQHPDYGYLVVCSEHDGLQHDCDDTRELRVATEDCERCGSVMVICCDCKRIISCCPCGQHHSTHCARPL